MRGPRRCAADGRERHAGSLTPTPDPAFPALPAHPEGYPWPTTEWPRGPRPDHVDGSRLHELTTGLIAEQPAELGQTLGLLIVHEGRIISEDYGPATDATTTLISWSMAKSILHALLGLLVVDGRLDPEAPAPLPEWADDQRATITIADLLAMRSGLEWCEDYVDDEVSDVITMLFGDGQADVAGYARAKPAATAPDTTFNYSSGTSNILAAIVGAELGGRDAVETLARERLLEPLGMQSTTMRFDAAGTFIGSSFAFATARDFARFGLLYLRDGTWDGQRLLPEGWVDRARRQRSESEPEPEPEPHPLGYGEHWWTIDDGYGTFCASGYEGQRIVVVPALDLVIVRLGKTPEELGKAWKRHLADLVDLFAERGGE